MITILGPTATGKTRLAAMLAYEIGGEVISADSRQVYRGMDIGTGKDFQDYLVKDHTVPAHLLDIVDAGQEYNVYRFQQDFRKAYKSIIEKGKTPVLCGGSGMYIESVLLGYDLMRVPQDKDLRQQLEMLPDEKLAALLSSLKKLHNTTDTINRERLIRAIEIAAYYRDHPDAAGNHFEAVDSEVFGIYFERSELRKRITERLKSRMDEGMIDEVKDLLNSGVKKEKLLFYGLEYKYVILYLDNKLSFDEMFSRLNTAIHQFAKRQMTWFRRMEKKGIKIRWINGSLDLQEKIDYILKESDMNL